MEINAQTEKRIVVLASGRGSNFAAIAKAVKDKQIPNARIVGLITNNPDAGAIDHAKSFDIPSFVVNSKKYTLEKKIQREIYEAALSEVITPLRPDLICLAGYMLILGDNFLEHWTNRILNIHPSLLPAFKGMHAQRQALESGVHFTGCTVHFVTPEVDTGPIVSQKILEIQKEDTEETLSKRLLPLEHQAYIDALEKLCSHKYRIEGARVNYH